MKRQKISRKIFVANRGEIAVRVIRSCREHGVKSVAVYSEADKNAPHVGLADEAYPIGGAPASESYMNIPRILEAASRSGATAIHPGYGFLSENPKFVKEVTRKGLKFIGPTEKAMRLLGDKLAARRLALSLGIPVVPGSPRPILTLREASSVARRVGYPVLIKAAGGGGGKGMRVAHSESELVRALSAARAEAYIAFSDDRIFLEKLIRKPRHVEVQVLADSHGGAIHLGERECSIQRRHQKVVEESPSTVIDAKRRSELTGAALRLVAESGYTNAGTVEFILDEDRNYYFLEVNTRLQVEHPVTEMRVGLDIVWEQIRIAYGEALRIKQEDVHFRGHAIECRVYAEDPANDFYPSSGLIVALNSPGGPGIREDRGVEGGSDISTYYDPMLSKVIAWGNTRNEAISRMIRALEDYEILGVKTNISMCLWILNNPEFRRGKCDTNFLSQHFSAETALHLPEDVIVAAAAACALKEKMTARHWTTREGVLDHTEWRKKSLDFMRGEAP